MPDFDPTQLRLDITPEVVEIESSDENIPDSQYLNPRTGDTISERDIENYSDTRPCSIFEAFHHYGVTPDDIIGGVKATSEIKKNHKKQVKVPPSANLADRADYLLEALDEHEQSIQAGQKMRELLVSGHNDQEVDAESYNEILHKNQGDAKFFKAWGAKALKEAGYKPIDFTYLAQREADDFFKLTSEPDNEKQRAQLVSNLTRQQIK